MQQKQSHMERLNDKLIPLEQICGGGRDFRNTLRVNFGLFAVRSPFNELTSQLIYLNRLAYEIIYSTSKHLSPSITYAAIAITFGFSCQIVDIFLEASILSWSFQQLSACRSVTPNSAPLMPSSTWPRYLPWLSLGCGILARRTKS